jgi:hypothetical protein
MAKYFWQKSDSVWGWGTHDRMKQAFGEDLTAIVPHDFPTDFRSPKNLHFKGLAEEALCAAMTRGKPLLSALGVHVDNPRYNVYKEGALKPTPSPLLLRRFTGAGGWHETCAGILGLTKMDWNNNTLYKKLPVTLVYSKAFADILQQNPNMVDSVYDFRNFM